MFRLLCLGEGSPRSASPAESKSRYAVTTGHPFLKLIDSLILKPYEHEPHYSVGLPHFTLFRNGDEMARKNSKRREWTKKDIRELKTLARAKTPAGKIARSLKRTEGATRQKAFALGLSLDTRG